MNRKQIILILLLTLCAAGIYAWVATPKQRRVSTIHKKSAPVNPLMTQVNNSDSPDIVDLDFSRRQANDYQKPQKNLFAPLYLPPKKNKKRPPPPLKVKKIVSKPTVVEPVAIKPRGLVPIPPLHVLGHLKNAGEVTVFLSSQTGEIHLLKQGDIFAAGLEIEKITAEKIYIKKKSTGQEVTLTLGEAKSQRLPGLKMVSGRPKFSPPSGNKTSGEGTSKAPKNKTTRIGEN